MEVKMVSITESRIPFELALELIRGGMFGNKVCVTFERANDQEKLQYTITEGEYDILKLLEFFQGRKE